MILKKYLKDILFYALLCGMTIWSGIDHLQSAMAHNGAIPILDILDFALLLMIWPKMLEGKQLPWQILINKTLKRCFIFFQLTFAIGVAVVYLKGVHMLPSWIYMLQVIIAMSFPFFGFEASHKSEAEIS